MPSQKRRTYTETDKAVALTFLSVLHGDHAAAAKKSNVPESLLRLWADNPDGEMPEVLENAAAAADVAAGRPRPPREMIEADIDDPVPAFAPAPDLEAWLRSSFLDETSPLYNEDHAHLEWARIGVLWTTVRNVRGGRRVVAQAERPGGGSGGKWAKARAIYQLLTWFGHVPDFLITFDALFCNAVADGTWCAISEHELYHCGQAKDLFDAPKYTKDGDPVYALLGHGVEEHIPIVRRYGLGALDGGVAQMVAAAQLPPLLQAEHIAEVCGTCRR